MTVGVLGGGQLGWMLALAGYPIGFHFRFLDPSPESPVGRLAPRVTGSYDDLQALERFAQALDLVTYEFENVPVASVRSLAARLPVYPPPDALEIAQDRWREKNLFRRLGIPTPPFRAVETREELEGAIDEIGLPAVLKTRRFGYDGKGQRVLRGPEDREAAWDSLGGSPLILEGFVDFDRELSLLAVRGRKGETRFYPLVENVHRQGILHCSRAPAPGWTPQLQAGAEACAVRLLDALGYVGVLAIELFDRGGTLLANEIAPRVHNSGHWTIEGAETSQFENHLRAIAGLPLGSTRALGHSLMVNLIGALPDSEKILSMPRSHLHLYGKQPRPGRKLGHVTLRAETAEELEDRRDSLEGWIRGEERET